MTYTIENISGRIKTVLLDHPLAKREGKFIFKSDLNPSNGMVTTRREFSSVPRGLTIPAGGRMKGQPDWVTEVAGIRQLVQAGDLKLSKETARTGRSSSVKPKSKSKSKPKAEATVEPSSIQNLKE